MFLFQVIFSKVSLRSGEFISIYTYVTLLVLMFFSSCSFKETSSPVILTANETEVGTFTSDQISLKNRTREKLEIRKYVEWYTENIASFTAGIDSGSYGFTIVNRPVEIETINNISGIKASDKEVDSIYNLKKDHFYVAFSVFPLKSSKEFKEKCNSQHAIFNIQKDFKLVIDNDTSDCQMLVPLREDLSIKGALSYYLIFNRKPTDTQIHPLQLLYLDRLFNTGLYRFTLDNHIFLSQPTLSNIKI